MLVIVFAIVVAIIAIRIAYRMSCIVGGEDEFSRFCHFVIMGVTPRAVLIMSLFALIHEVWGV